MLCTAITTIDTCTSKVGCSY